MTVRLAVNSRESHSKSWRPGGQIGSADSVLRPVPFMPASVELAKGVGP